MAEFPAETDDSRKGINTGGIAIAFAAFVIVSAAVGWVVAARNSPEQAPPLQEDFNRNVEMASGGSNPIQREQLPVPPEIQIPEEKQGEKEAREALPQLDDYDEEEEAGSNDERPVKTEQRSKPAKKQSAPARQEKKQHTVRKETRRTEAPRETTAGSEWDKPGVAFTKEPAAKPKKTPAGRTSTSVNITTTPESPFNTRPGNTPPADTYVESNEQLEINIADLVSIKDFRADPETGVPIDDSKNSRGTAAKPPAQHTVVERVQRDDSAAKVNKWYAVKVGITESKIRAEVLRDVLQNQGFGHARAKQSTDGNWYVSLGDYQFRHEAQEMIDEVKSRTSLIPTIVEKTVVD